MNLTDADIRLDSDSGDNESDYAMQARSTAAQLKRNREAKAPKASKVTEPADGVPLGGRLDSAARVRTYVDGGHGSLTLRSVKTGTRYTYKIGAPKDGSSIRFVGVLMGPNNVDDYQFLGVASERGFYPSKKNLSAASAPSFKAFAWAWGQVLQGKLPEALEVWHEGRCCRCGRPLTVPESVADGIGPICATKG